MGALDKDETKHAVKEALKEWLDDKFVEFGKWSMGGLAAALIGGIVYLFLISEGWHK